MQRHISWSKKPVESNPNNLSIKKKKYNEDNFPTILLLIDNGEEISDRFLVKFQGKLIFYSHNYNEAKRVFDLYDKENFND